MPQSLANKTPIEFRTQTGIVTEASPLNFPEGASVDEQNFVIKRDGSRERRFGLDIEDTGVFTSTGVLSASVPKEKFQSYLWVAAGNDASVNITVVAVGNTLWFFDAGAEILSGSPLNSGNSLSLSTSGDTELQFTTVAGDLYIVNGSQQITSLSYDQDSDTVTSRTFRIKIRDFFGVEDGLRVDERPAALSISHNYNLRNQGWPEEDHYIEANNTRDDLVQITKTRLGKYPSNSDIWHTALIFDPEDGQNEYRALELFEYTTEAPLGHYIIDAFNRSSSRLEAMARHPSVFGSTASFPSDVSTDGVVAVGSYAGRVWYAAGGGKTTGDTRSPYISTFVFYSRIVDNIDDAGKCYSQNDPTDKDISDVLDTDGGFIRIPEARGIHRLVPMQDSLIVFAENGIWAITGGDAGFSATDQRAIKVSNVGSLSPSSVAEAEGSIFYWGDSGVYVVQQTETSVYPTAQNLTETTIQSLYNAIPSVSKRSAKGFFDADERAVRWLYNSGQSWYGGSSWTDRYDAELILNLTIPAWYKNVIDDDGSSVPALTAYVDTESFTRQVGTEAVTSGGEIVTSDGDTVTISTVDDTSITSKRRYLIIDTSTTTARLAFAEYRDTNFEDWPSYTANDAAAYVVTGYVTGGDTAREKRAPYVTVHMTRTETGFELSGSEYVFTNPSGCKMQAQWEWANSANSGRWGTEWEVYRYKRPWVPSGSGDTLDYGFSVITTKNRIRGSGRALSIKFSSEPGKDLKLLGWSLDITANPEQ